MFDERPLVELQRGEIANCHTRARSFTTSSGDFGVRLLAGRGIPV